MVKQIINWTAGSFFRTLGRILLYITIGALIGLFCVNNDIKLPQWLTFIDRVDALTTITPSSYKHKITGLKYNDGILENRIETSWFEGDYTNFCTGTNRYCYLEYDYYYVVLPSSLSPGNTYTWTFNTWVTTRPTQSQLNKIKYWVTASNSGSYSGSSEANINIFNCRAGIEEGSTTKISFTCSITPATSINYIYLRMDYGNLNTSGNLIYGYTPFTSYGCNRGQFTFDNSQTDAINQQTSIIQNEFNEITNQINENNQLVIDSLTNLEDTLTENQKVCNTNSIDKDDISINGKYLNSNGDLVNGNNWGVTDYIQVKEMTVTNVATVNNIYVCFYNKEKVLISCSVLSSLGVGNVNLPDNTYYFRSSVNSSYNVPQYTIKSCINGNQAISDVLTDSNTEVESGAMADFINDFTLSGDHLSDLLIIPINFIENVFTESSTDDLCTTFMGKNICLPNGSIIWNKSGCHMDNPFGCSPITPFRTLLNVLVGGFLSFKMVRSFIFTSDKALNPKHNGIEVMKL